MTSPPGVPPAAGAGPTEAAELGHGELTDGEPTDDEPTDGELADDELAARCTRFLRWPPRIHQRGRLAELVAQMPDIEPDVYGEGGVVAELEREVATLLGKPAAVFMPSGTMAQQIALRVHADARHRQVIAFHPTCHVELHEDGAYHRLHGLVGRPVGDARRLLTLEDLQGVAEPLAAVLWELPQREIGGRLPSWDDLTAQTAWAAGRGAAAHLDGARLWESGPHYDSQAAAGRDLAEIAALFDTVYVSFYKGLGGLSGCCLLGSEEVIGQSREWRSRHGGTLFALWPYAASALVGLRQQLPRMREYVEHAIAIAAELRQIAGVEVVPDPPQTPMMHLDLPVSAAALRAASRRLALEEGVWTWPRSFPTDSPSRQRVELAVGEGTLGCTPAEVRRLVERLVAAVPSDGPGG